MEEKVIAWNKGSGNITLRYEGSGTSDITIESDANDLTEEREQTVVISSVEFPSLSVNLLVRQEALKEIVVGTILNFDFTGTVKSVVLPAGRYFLQCWGAQGGNVSDNDDNIVVEGSKGGYSEGILTLSEQTTLYIFVGGQGDYDDYYGNGGWNGGGGAYGYCANTNKTYETFYASGGGGTDICTVTSDMEYDSAESDGRNNRTSESLLSRFIVAGGGAGASVTYNYGEYASAKYISDGGQQGGGENGCGKYYGTQTSAGGGSNISVDKAEFGKGASVWFGGGSYYVCSGAGGGGWYGGGAITAGSYDICSDSGGGSGFVNIAANKEYRPEEYTGLELYSGTTIAGDSSFVSVDGGTETGHSGNGYARITRLVNTIILWESQEGEWKEESYNSAVDGKKQYVSLEFGNSGNRRIRCSFYGFKSITFSYTYHANSMSYIYFLIGNIDKECTTTDYKTKVTTAGSDKTESITITPSDNGEHYIEFYLYRANIFGQGNVSIYIESAE